MRPLKYLRYYQALSTAYLGVLVWLTLTPQPPPSPDLPFVDKWEHLLVYGLLMGSCGQWLSQRGRLRLRFAVIFVALGAVLELLQGLGGVRHMESADAVANALGVGIGYAITRGPGGRILQALEQRLIQA